MVISRCAEFYRIVAVLRRYTTEPIGVILSIGLLNELFKEKWSRHLDGGILESFGRLFKDHVRLLVSPWKNRKTGDLVTAESFRSPERFQSFYEFLWNNGYVVDLPWRHTLSFSGAYSRTNGLVAAPFALTGTSWQVAANYDLPLADLRPGFTHALQLGLDFKASDNNFTFASIPITDNLTHVAQARLTYSGRLQSALGVTSFRASLTSSPGGLTDRNETEFFNVSRSGARADYVYLRLGGSHAVPLDPIKAGLSWTVRGQAQLANHNLIGSEQFGGGGAYSVRGYEEGEIYKDNGVLFSHELRLPPFALRPGHTLQLYGFQDYARLWSTDPLPGERAADLHSVGAGVDYSFGQRVSLRAAHGWQLSKSGSSETGKSSRLHLSANLSF